MPRLARPVTLLAALSLVLTALPAHALPLDTGGSPTPSPRAAQVDPGAFVTSAYRGLLGRDPEPAGLSYWRGRLQAGTPPRAVLELIGDSAEHRNHVVVTAYRRFLRRNPEAAGRDFWAAALGRTFTVTRLHGELLASDEYWRVQGGGTPQGFVRALYRDVLGRQPDPGGLAHWSGVVAAGVPRGFVAILLLESPESTLRPDLAVVGSQPASRTEVTALGQVRVTLDTALVPEASTVLVFVAGRRVPGTVTRGSSATQLVFTPTRGASWVGIGTPVDVVVTVLGYDGSSTGRADVSFRYRPRRTPSALFEAHRLVAFYGSPASPVLGVMGEGTPEQAAQRLLTQARPYRSAGRPVVPVFELIATLALSSPGPEGNYSAPTPISRIRPYLDAIREVGGMLVLDIQAGRADPLAEARRYEELLVEPDVGLALDPEWTVGPDQRPGGGRIGSIDASTINAVSGYLAGLVERHGLPEKPLVIHRFTPGMVTREELVVARPGVAIAFHADGIGTPAAKFADYFGLMPDRFPRGIKVFYDEDTPVLSPAELLRLDPAPDIVTYQ